MNYDQWKRERAQNDWKWDIQRFEFEKQRLTVLRSFKFSDPDWLARQIERSRAVMQSIKDKYPSHLKNEQF